MCPDCVLVNRVALPAVGRIDSPAARLIKALTDRASSTASAEAFDSKQSTDQFKRASHQRPVGCASQLIPTRFYR